MMVRIQLKNPLLLVILYRPPPSKQNKYTVRQFLEEVEEFIANIYIKHHGGVIIMGDFNMHWEKQEVQEVKKLSKLFRTFTMTQHVDKPTHKDNGILDLVLANESAKARVSAVKSEPIGASDHYLVTYQLRCKVCTPQKIRLTCCKLRSVNVNDLTTTLKRNMDGPVPVCMDKNGLDLLVKHYETTITKSLDAHAPKKTITLKSGTRKDWYDDEVHQARRKRRRLERQYKKTKLEIHKQMLDEQSKEVVTMIKDKKASFFQKTFREADHMETFRLVNTLLTAPQQPAFTAEREDSVLAEDFRSFFDSKIRTICNLLRPAVSSDHNETPCSPAAVLLAFTPYTEEAILRIIQKSPSKSCELDPIPTWLLKKPGILETLLSTITEIINKSLHLCYVPEDFKMANLKPRLKKPGADTSQLSNYRPVSNLQFISKILERAVAAQITRHLEERHLMDPLQSAYRRGHSTETAMLRVKNDIDTILDEGDGVLLVLLDLSAAFDTIDHGILLRRLEHTIGIRGDALEWIRSYLTDRYQKVTIRQASSEKSALSTGVPQGSVLGPLLFSLYMLPLREIIKKHEIQRHHYADDTQLYTRLRIRNSPAGSVAVDVRRMERCVEELRSWMTENKLKLNDSKTEVLVVSTKTNKHEVENIQVKVGDDIIKPSTSVRDLGSYLDSTMSMEEQVSRTVRACYLQLRSIGHVRRSLDSAACAKVINATVTARQDYHNALLAGSHMCVLKPLQRMQNQAARMLTRTPRTDHITPVLRELHWLPVKERADFKLLVQVQRAVHDPRAPEYLREMFARYQAPRHLRSSDDPCTLTINRVNRHEGERCASHQGAVLWNALPADLQCAMTNGLFKKKLKTFFFNRVFN